MKSASRRRASDRADQSATLIATLAELLAVIAAKIPPADKLGQLETIVAARGGCEDTAKGLRGDTPTTARSRWQPFAYRAFSPYRTELLLLGRTLPLKAARPSANNLIEAVHSVVTEPTTSDYYARGFRPVVSAAGVAIACLRS